MKFIIAKKEMTLGNKYKIKDEAKKTIYKVKGKTFAIGNKINFYDIDSNIIFYIEQQMKLKAAPVYKIFAAEEQVAHIESKFKKLTAFNVEIDSDIGKLVISSSGNQFVIYRYNEAIATMKKKRFALGNKYDVEVIHESKYELMLAICITIDLLITDLQGIGGLLPV